MLVDRLWPRGLTKSQADLDDWCKDIAPSPALRKWYSHEPQLFDEFARRYRVELADPVRANALAQLLRLTDRGVVTLLTATKNPEISEAAVLADLLREWPKRSEPAGDL